MFKACIMFKGGDLKTVNVVNVQIIPRKNTSYPYSEEYPDFEDEYNVIYMEYNGVKSNVVSNLSDITVLF